MLAIIQPHKKFFHSYKIRMLKSRNLTRNSVNKNISFREVFLSPSLVNQIENAYLITSNYDYGEHSKTFKLFAQAKKKKAALRYFIY